MGTGEMIDETVRKADAGPRARTSLVDDAERALRAWLEPARFRTGDRLPTEERLAAMLGVSRGTLRSALRRLEASGEIVRRQGSGTFVGHIAPVAVAPSAILPLRVNSYTARARDARVVVRSMQIGPWPVDARAAAVLELPVGEPALRIDRVVFTEAGRPMGVALDIVHPELRLPDAVQLRALLEDQPLHEVLRTDVGIVVSVARTWIDARLVEPQDREGRLLELETSTACLTLEEHCLVGGRPLLYSWDVIVAGQLDIGFVQSTVDSEPAPVAGGH